MPGEQGPSHPRLYVVEIDDLVGTLAATRHPSMARPLETGLVAGHTIMPRQPGKLLNGTELLK